YPADEFYATPEGADVALAAVYAKVAGNWDGVGYAGADNGWYDMNSMSSDEQVIPIGTPGTGNWILPGCTSMNGCHRTLSSTIRGTGSIRPSSVPTWPLNNWRVPAPTRPRFPRPRSCVPFSIIF